ncbi:hypothetical protein I3842_04G116800 [Carya illinoinensis]|uniref:Terpene synthase metal-binding domain-containing protein n=1 Tax=Carya illinoinensis TaxID=32201 RepID=A0A922FC01_CARIL|nr:hypothetical protein I3842_04G116800 [Carya illinoinensis]
MMPLTLEWIEKIFWKSFKDFSTKNLDSNSAIQVKESLEIPLHWRMSRVEARYFIDVYQKDTTMSLTLLELAMLDYNLVQSVHQQEVKELARMGLTKFVCILTAIDDVYDVYGSLDELECFTDAVNRWEMKAMENLPE